MIKSYYFGVAKGKANSIEEIDCLIEEYKNISKIKFSNAGILFLTLINIFFVTTTTMYTNQTTILMSIYSNAMSFITGEKEATPSDRSEAINQISQLVPSDNDNSFIFEYLGYALCILLIILLICGLINRFRQKRLSGFYEYKRELIREKNECTDKSTDL